jgi:hypothetical protein
MSISAKMDSIRSLLPAGPTLTLYGQKARYPDDVFDRRAGGSCSFGKAVGRQWLVKKSTKIAVHSSRWSK